MLLDDHNFILHLNHQIIHYKQNILSDQKNGKQGFEIRKRSRICLDFIQRQGDTAAQSQLVAFGYVRILIIVISTAGGLGEEHDQEINEVLIHISDFLFELHKGRNAHLPHFQSESLLARRSIEQIEDEGGNEEIDSQLINKGKEILFARGSFKKMANDAKGQILNFYIDKGCKRPWWY
ncbi:MAG: hypothetical protein EZS28_025239 [Streblomastix strix]|uniref:Uncharacterized protein n=1 Tax=Streblomastix strix TaxID=222440 RepID=A0A5J4V9P2_9EUKA|nr:MAG: hypothetical protein EZS28_025239 [Streblomastix strix]